MSLIASSVSATTIFSANWDNGFNAQVAPVAGSVVPTIIDADGDSGLTTGGLGWNGGEALLVKDQADKINYQLGAVNVRDWFPVNGRASMKVKFNQTIPSTTIQLFAFTYSANPALELFCVELGYLGHSAVPGGWVSIRGKDATISSSLRQYMPSTAAEQIPGMAGNVIGWHDVVVEWTEVAAYQAGVQQETLNVSVYVDGLLAYNQPAALVGSPQYMDVLSFGSWVNLPPLGNYSNSVIDEFRLEAIPEPATMGLLLCGSIGMILRNRKK